MNRIRGLWELLVGLSAVVACVAAVVVVPEIRKQIGLDPTTSIIITIPTRENILVSTAFVPTPISSDQQAIDTSPSSSSPSTSNTKIRNLSELINYLITLPLYYSIPLLMIPNIVVCMCVLNAIIIVHERSATIFGIILVTIVTYAWTYYVLSYFGMDLTLTIGFTFILSFLSGTVSGFILRLFYSRS